MFFIWDCSFPTINIMNGYINDDENLNYLQTIVENI